MTTPRLNDNFSTYPVGQQPSTKTWASFYHKPGDAKPFAHDDASFVVASVGGVTCVRSNMAQQDMTINYDDADADDWQDYEYTGRILSASGTNFGIVWYSEHLQAKDIYYRLSSSADKPHWHVVFHPHGTTPVTGLLESAKQPAPNVWYRFRVQVFTEPDRDSSRAKIWKDGDKEPDAWDIEFHDTRKERPKQGTIGFWCTNAADQCYTDVVVTPFTGVIDDPITPTTPPAPAPATGPIQMNTGAVGAGTILVTSLAPFSVDDQTLLGAMVRQTDRLYIYTGYKVSDDNKMVNGVLAVLLNTPEYWTATDSTGTYYPVADALANADGDTLNQYALYVSSFQIDPKIGDSTPAPPTKDQIDTAIRNVQSILTGRYYALTNIIAIAFRDDRKVLRFDLLYDDIIDQWYDPKNMDNKQWWGLNEGG
jgi:hypothetical protein